LPAIQLPPAIRSVARPVTPTDDDDELTTGSDGSQLQRIDDARYIAAHGHALVELGVDRDGERSPDTLVVRGASQHAELVRAAFERRWVLHGRDELVVGFESADPAALKDAVARHVAALAAANVPAQGLLGAAETAERTFEIDRD